MSQRCLTAVFCVLVVMLPCAFSPAVADPGDVEGGKDPALFSRMPGFRIVRCEERAFDRYEFPIAADFRAEAVEGRFLWVVYEANEGGPLPGGIQVVRNYANAAAQLGGKKVAEFEDGGTEHLTLKIVRGDAETWVHVAAAGNGQYSVHLVEREAMRQDVAADAGRLAGSIRESGRAAVYGILFDTGKAEIKAESEPALKEIARLLQEDGSLKLYVVGHTDNTGTFEANVRLSACRAEAVVKALVAGHGVAAPRLQPFGAGPTAPVASNLTEEGRAKNRRVDLVAQ